MGVVIFSFFALLTISPKHFLLSSLTGFLQHPYYTQYIPFSSTCPCGSHSMYACQRRDTGWSVQPRHRGHTRSLGGEAPILFLSALAEFCAVLWKGDGPRDHEDQVLAPQLPTMWTWASVSSPVNKGTGLWGKPWWSGLPWEMEPRKWSCRPPSLFNQSTFALISVVL